MEAKRDPDATLGELFGRVAVRLRQAMAASFDDFDLGGLSPHQGRIVGWIEANEDRGVIQRDVAEITGTRASSVSSLLQGLEQDGWIERRTDPADSRRKTLHVTPKAREVVKRFETRSWDGANAALDSLDADERATLAALLTKLDRHLAGQTGS